MTALENKPTTAVVWRNLDDLGVHPLAAKMPMLPEDAPEMVALGASIELHGLERQSLIIDERDRIMDGRHRRLMAKRAGLKEVPCIVRPTEEAASLIVDSLVGRRHYRRGARAYLVAPLLMAAAEINKDARTQQLIESGPSSRKPLQAVFGKTEEELAAQFGFSGDTANRAKNIHKSFSAATERRAKWAQKYPELVKQFGGVDKIALGQALPDFADPLPDDLRAVYEPKILSGEMGLGAVMQAIAGLESTKGQPKQGRGGESLFYEAMNTFQLRFGYYDSFGEDAKQTAIKTFADWLAARPLEFRQGVLAALTQSKS